MKVIAESDSLLMLVEDDVDEKNGVIFKRCVVLDVKEELRINSVHLVGSWFNHVSYWEKPSKTYANEELDIMLSNFRVQT